MAVNVNDWKKRLSKCYRSECDKWFDPNDVTICELSVELLVNEVEARSVRAYCRDCYIEKCKELRICLEGLKGGDMKAIAKRVMTDSYNAKSTYLITLKYDNKAHVPKAFVKFLYSQGINV